MSLFSSMPVCFFIISTHFFVNLLIASTVGAVSFLQMITLQTAGIVLCQHKSSQYHSLLKSRIVAVLQEMSSHGKKIHRLIVVLFSRHLLFFQRLNFFKAFCSFRRLSVFIVRQDADVDYSRVVC